MMEETGIKILYRGGTGEIVEKKSRFIATVCKIEGEEEALAFVAQMRRKYWDARHHCYAFVAGDSHQLARCSDDGEPAGTAGRPILDVLLGEDIHNAVVVVTRYFGGTLLGTGGLVRAYQGAAREGLKNSLVVLRRRGRYLTVETDYGGLGKVQYLLAKEGVRTVDSVYGEQVALKLLVPLAALEKLKEDLTEATGGRALLAEGDTVDFAEAEGELVLFC